MAQYNKYKRLARDQKDTVSLLHLGVHFFSAKPKMEKYNKHWYLRWQQVII